MSGRETWAVRGSTARKRQGLTELAVSANDCRLSWVKGCVGVRVESHVTVGTACLAWLAALCGSGSVVQGVVFAYWVETGFPVASARRSASSRPTGWPRRLPTWLIEGRPGTEGASTPTGESVQTPPKRWSGYRSQCIRGARELELATQDY